MKVVLSIMELVRLSLSSVLSSCSFDAKDQKPRPKSFLYCHVQRISRGTCPHRAFRGLRMRLISFCLGWRGLVSPQKASSQ